MLKKINWLYTLLFAEKDWQPGNVLVMSFIVVEHNFSTNRNFFVYIYEVSCFPRMHSDNIVLKLFSINQYESIKLYICYEFCNFFDHIIVWHSLSCRKNCIQFFIKLFSQFFWCNENLWLCIWNRLKMWFKYHTYDFPMKWEGIMFSCSSPSFSI